MGALINLTGRRFGLWIVLNRSSDLNIKSVMWDCKCDCGVTKPVNSSNLLSGGSMGCGCARYSNMGVASTTHGQTKNRKIPPTYHSWAGMKARCSNSRHIGYANYGGKGIKVCERWLSYENFFEDMGEKPKGFSIDRIDANGDYTPENCRWASYTQQANNKTNNHVISALGETKTLQEWANSTGVSHGSLLFRIYKAKWPLEKALTTPSRGYGGRKASN